MMEALLPVKWSVPYLHIVVLLHQTSHIPLLTGLESITISLKSVPVRAEGLYPQLTGTIKARYIAAALAAT